MGDVCVVACEVECKQHFGQKYVPVISVVIDKGCKTSMAYCIPSIPSSLHTALNKVDSKAGP